MKNKPLVIAVTMLAAFISYCGWLAYHYQGGEDNGKGLYAPNTMHRIALPPPISPDTVRQTVVAASQSDTNLQIDGKQIVVTSRGNMLDPERHDYAHALARAEHKLTKTLQ